MRTAFLVVGLVATLAAPARADLIVIDANHYRPGTDLTTLFSGLSMAHLHNDPNHDGTSGRELYRPIASPVYAVSTHHAPELLSVGGLSRELVSYTICAGSVNGSSECPQYDVLELRFDAPTDLVQIDSRWFSDQPGILAYDALGNLLRTWGNGINSPLVRYSETHTPVGNDWASTLTLESDQPLIARIIYGGLAGPATPTRVAYNVPEPTTLVLITLGLVGARLLSRWTALKAGT